MTPGEESILNAARDFVKFSWSIYEDLKDEKNQPKAFMRLCETVERVDGVPEE